MARVLYVIPERFSASRLDLQVSVSNPGGGVSTKVQRVYEILSRYYEVIFTTSLSRYDAGDIIFLDPLAVRMTDNPETVVSQYEHHQAKLKILNCTEQSIMEISEDFRARLYRASMVTTSCCDFQENQLLCMGYPTVRLCDPIPPVFYNPTATKELGVVALGQISYDKNIPMLIELFNLLQGKGIKTVYIGSASLWGQNSVDNRLLEKQLLKVTNEFYPNVPQYMVARLLGQYSCAVFLADHETYSESNAEALMASVLCFYGLHELWTERPGVHGLDTPLDFLHAIGCKTQDFKKSPSYVYGRKSVDWALANCSYETFLKQWEGVVSYAKW